ncbi:hypothetical protein [Streptomyces sp. NPDC002402]
MNTLRKTVLVTSSLALTAAGVVATTSTTASATTRANYCGSSYTFLKSWPITALSWTSDAGRTVGYIDIYWSRSAGKNCAIARPNNGIYNPNHIQVSIRRTGTGWSGMDGLNQNYRKYAGPVYVSAPNSCIDFEGGFDYGLSGHTGFSKYYRKHCG